MARRGERGPLRAFKTKSTDQLIESAETTRLNRVGALDLTALGIGAIMLIAGVRQSARVTRSWSRSSSWCWPCSSGWA